MRIWIVGARGAIATTLAAGVVAAQRGLMPLEAVLTETAPFQALDLARLEDIAIGGCDLAPGTLAETAQATLAGVGSFPVAVIEQLMPELSRIVVTRGIMRAGGPAIDLLAGDQRAASTAGTAREAVERIVADLRAFSTGSRPSW